MKSFVLSLLLFGSAFAACAETATCDTVYTNCMSTVSDVTECLGSRSDCLNDNGCYDAAAQTTCISDLCKTASLCTDMNKALACYPKCDDLAFLDCQGAQTSCGSGCNCIGNALKCFTAANCSDAPGFNYDKCASDATAASCDVAVTCNGTTPVCDTVGVQSCATAFTACVGSSSDWNAVSDCLETRTTCINSHSCWSSDEESRCLDDLCAVDKTKCTSESMDIASACFPNCDQVKHTQCSLDEVLCEGGDQCLCIKTELACEFNAGCESVPGWGIDYCPSAARLYDCDVKDTCGDTGDDGGAASSIVVGSAVILVTAAASSFLAL